MQTRKPQLQREVAIGINHCPLRVKITFDKLSTTLATEFLVPCKISHGFRLKTRLVSYYVCARDNLLKIE